VAVGTTGAEATNDAGAGGTDGGSIEGDATLGVDASPDGGSVETEAGDAAPDALEDGDIPGTKSDAKDGSRDAEEARCGSDDAGEHDGSCRDGGQCCNGGAVGTFYCYFGSGSCPLVP
jgi:hypothetical protein